MQPSVQTTLAKSRWEDLHQLELPNPSQLDNIKFHLDLVLLALEAIASIASEGILQAAKELNLTS